ncbi:hypothetical protein D9M69_319600 [compost metagenome]
MIARLDGASSGFGFSTILFTRKMSSRIISPEITPYLLVSSGGTSWMATMEQRNWLYSLTICLRTLSPSRFRQRSSARTTANGSSPISGRPVRMAWPRPFISTWRV